MPAYRASSVEALLRGLFMSPISGIHHASLLVDDTEKSLAFYQGVLGLAVDTLRPDLGFAGAWLHVGRQQIHLLELPCPDRSHRLPEHGGRDRHIALFVDSIEWIAARLDTAGIRYTQSRSGRNALFCRDPDGNTLEFVVRPVGV